MNFAVVLLQDEFRSGAVDRQHQRRGVGQPGDHRVERGFGGGWQKPEAKPLTPREDLTIERMERGEPNFNYPIPKDVSPTWSRYQKAAARVAKTAQALADKVQDAAPVSSPQGPRPNAAPPRNEEFVLGLKPPR